jgi:hypothetical protein
MEAVAIPDAWAPTVHDRPDCWCFGCRIDVVGMFDSGEAGIVEIKTGKKLQPTHFVQLDAQVELAIHNQVTHGRERGIVLQLLPDTYHVHEAEDRHWPLLKAAAKVAQWRLRHDTKARLSGDGPHALRRVDGIRVPGVGTVMSLAGMTDLSSIPPHILETAAQRGAYVHEMVELDVTGNLDRDALPDWLRGYLHQWDRFCWDEGFTPQRAEVAVINHCER